MSKILFVFHNVYFYRYFDGVVRSLRARGHQVSIAVDLKMMSSRYTDRALQKCVEETGCDTEPIIFPRGRSKYGAVLRDIIGYANYFRPDHPSPTWAATWKRVLKNAHKFINLPFVDGLLKRASVREYLRSIERDWPPDPRVAARLENGPPDVIVACPFIWALSADVDYVKVAAQLGIPTVVAVASWDHLGGKGLFPMLPDVTLVWNEEMARDGTDLQDIPANKLVMTGAPPFDFWFNAEANLDRSTFLNQASLASDRPYIVFLGSSKPIAGLNDPGVVKKIVEVLRASEDTKDIQILVRPYPSRSFVWNDFHAPNTRIWPRDGEWPDVDGARQNLFDTLYHSLAVIGINTTAMLEACVIGKPCLAIMTEEFKSAQTERAHFQQVLRGGFLEIAEYYQAVVPILQNLLSGKDTKIQARKDFSHSFFRPHGLQFAASDLAATAIEMAASGKIATEINQSFLNK